MVPWVMNINQGALIPENETILDDPAGLCQEMAWDSGLGFISGFTTNASCSLATLLSWVLSTSTPDPFFAIGKMFLERNGSKFF